MDFKGTKTDWHAIEFAGFIILKDSEFYEGKNILDYSDVGKEVAEANARLAIKAPKLLEVLKKCKTELEYLYSEVEFEGKMPMRYLLDEVNQLIKESTL